MPRRTSEEKDDRWEMHGHRMCCHGRGFPVFGLFVLLIGLSWLGNDLGWWNFNLPWIPLAIVLVGAAMVFGWARRHEYS